MFLLDLLETDLNDFLSWPKLSSEISIFKGKEGDLSLESATFFKSSIDSIDLSFLMGNIFFLTNPSYFKMPSYEFET